MNDYEFQLLLNKLHEYLATEKTFVENSIRTTEIKNAAEIAHELFPEAKICIKDNPLQMGAMILRIELADINLNSEKEIKLFSELISASDNFEIYAHQDDYIVFVLLFQNAYTRIQ